jgi:hypothetical protein
MNYTHVMVHEPKLLSSNLGRADESAVMCDHGFEIPSKVLAVNPIDHEATVARTSSNSVLNINVFEIVADVFPALDKIPEGSAT